MGFGIGGINFQALPILRYRFVHLAFLQESITKIIVSHYKVRFELQGLLKLNNGGINFSFLKQGNTKIVIELGIMRFDFQSLSILIQCIVHLPSIEQDTS